MVESSGQSLEVLLSGRKLGHYRIESPIGRGGMGIVFRARDTHLGRRVAIKVLEENSARQEESFQRFVREARLAAQLSHPNIVTIHEVNQDGEYVYIAMELLDGSAQDRLAQQGKLGWETAARTLRSVCRGLDVAHAHGLIHRDIKPANILASRSGNVKLGDFGLARRYDATSSLTTDGLVLGTSHFMSPEQCEGQPADRRSDVYSMGATFHALLTGLPPYPGDDPLQVAFAHCSAPLPNPCLSDEAIPGSCREIVQQAMEKQPSDRYQSASEMLRDLTRCLTDSSSKAPSLPLGIQTDESRGVGRGQRDQLRDRSVFLIGSALTLSFALCVVLLLSVAHPHTDEGAGETAKEHSGLNAGDAGLDSGGTPASKVSFSTMSPREKLAALFAAPGIAEIQSARAEWMGIPRATQQWREEARRMGRMQLVSYEVDGNRLHALVRRPDDYSSDEVHAAIVFCCGEEGTLSPSHLRGLRMRLPMMTDCVVVMPVFRGQSIAMGMSQREIRSEGDRQSVIAEATDVMALLDRMSQEIPRVDAFRFLAVGTGRRAAVAIQLGIRDQRIRAVIAAEADADGFQSDVERAVLLASTTGETPETRLARTVWHEIAEPLLNGTHGLVHARRQLLSLSPARFVEYLPPTEIYYGAFTSEYETQQRDVFRETYRGDSARRYFNCTFFAAGPHSPLTIRAIQRRTRRLINDVVDGRIPGR